MIILVIYLLEYKWLAYVVDHNECAKDRNPCMNGATCDNRNGTFNCICPKGWKGVHCDIGKLCIISKWKICTLDLIWTLIKKYKKRLVHCFLFLQTSMNVRLWSAPVSLVELVTTLMALTTASVHHTGEGTTAKSVSMVVHNDWLLTWSFAGVTFI